MFSFDRDPALIESSSTKMKGGFDAMDKILQRRGLPPTAVVAHNDIIAIGAMDAIKLHGLSIPGDISVCGFDDIRHAADVVPSLSTVHVPIRSIGTIAVHRILQAISGKRDLIRRILIPTSLVIRDSIACAKSR
jgi:DNA-binding LacI/PurR family transcriptional regulator